jgi:predicted nucleic-acid-binding Zn-ribbon protein
LKKTRILAFGIFVIVAVLLVLPYLVAAVQYSVSDLITLYGLLAVALVLLAGSGPSQQQGRPVNKGTKLVETKTITSIACYNCKFVEEREFERGDFIGKALGKCPKCKGQRYIKSIYDIEEKRK